MASTQQMQARAKAAKKAAKHIHTFGAPAATFVKPAGQNAYHISVDMPQEELKSWLKSRDCPKAAASVQAGAGYTSTFMMTGNVSAISALANFDRLSLRYTSKPLGDSLPLGAISSTDALAVGIANGMTFSL